MRIRRSTMKSAIELFETEVTGVTTKGVCMW